MIIIFITWSAAIQADQVVIGDYPAARGIFWKQLYPKGYTLYCGERFTNRKKTLANQKMHVEHVFAGSWMAKAIGCGKRKECRKTSARFNLAEADLHNLYPVRSKINSSRNNLEFGIITDEKHRFGCDFERTNKVAEPREIARGNIARSILYMVDEYNFKISDEMHELMIEWHQVDPPSKDELRRNKIIKGLQGTSNTYIDQ